jgi:uncharacterized membrane protein
MTLSKRSIFPSRFFSDAEKETIRTAIEAAEERTSGEIRVHLDRRCAGDPLDAARGWFAKLRMEATRDHNGVLLYLAIADRKFALLGDSGIHEALPEGTWEALRDRMVDEFSKDRFAEGIAAAIAEIGGVLAARFPRRADDTDELPDELSTSDGE